MSGVSLIFTLFKCFNENPLPFIMCSLFFNVVVNWVIVMDDAVMAY